MYVSTYVTYVYVVAWHSSMCGEGREGPWPFVVAASYSHSPYRN